MYKVLIVDDEKMIRMGIRNGIPWEKLGVDSVYTAASAMEALEIIGKEHPQIMLTDISMTTMTGLDLIEKIRKENQEMRILVLTGYDRFDYARQCLQMRVQNFLLKPIDEEELMSNIREQVQALEEICIQTEAGRRRKRTEGYSQQMALETFMRGLLSSSAEEREELIVPEELKMDAEHKMQAAVLIPDLYMDENDARQSFRMLTVKNICMGLIDARRQGITFVDNFHRLVIVFFTDIEDRSIMEQAQELCEILEDEGGMKPRIVLGGEITGLRSLHVSYNDAMYLLKQEEKGFQEIVRADKERDRERMIQEVFTEMKKAITSNLANEDYVLHVFENFRKATESYNFSKSQIQKSCFEIASEIYFTYVMNTGESIENKLETLVKSLTSAGREDALAVTGGFIQSLITRESKEEHEIISKARHYIEEDLGGELSVANLAEHFYVSPNYFSRLFKKVTGEGCNEYIVKKRIEKSRILLGTTTLKVGKIASIVGYNDTNYFSLAFKKHVGMSPIKYREKTQNGKEEDNP